MMAARVLATSPAIQLSEQRELFTGGFMSFQPTVPQTYDVLPDGRFVMVQLESEVEARREIAVILNWFQDLAQRFPSGN